MKKRGAKDFTLLALKGCAMGAADVVPGVSGGTIAFISGIYTELINSIKSVDVAALKLLFSFRIKDFWKKINGSFLFSVLGGIAISILSLAKAMSYLLENHPIMIWSFFFGLIVASAGLIFKEVKKFNVASLIAIIAGAAIASYITVMSPTETPNDWWFIVLCGAIAICAMILPGISGSFILLLMGKYAYILNAVSTFEVTTLGLFITGAVIGIVSFSHLLSWLLKKFHTATLSLLTGFMIGSLYKVWPWKETISTTVNSSGETIPLMQNNVLPNTFETISGEPSQLPWAIAMALVGFLTIFVVEWIGNSMKKQSPAQK